MTKQEEKDLMDKSILQQMYKELQQLQNRYNEYYNTFYPMPDSKEDFEIQEQYANNDFFLQCLEAELCEIQEQIENHIIFIT